MKMIPYGTQYIDQADIDEVIKTITGDYMTQGPRGSEFERKVADYHNCKYAVAFSNGTAALHGAYYASGIGIGESFVTSPITFVASANAGIYLGATPKFADIDPKTYNLDPEKVKEVLTDEVKVITPVSFAGYPVDLKKFREVVGDKRVIIHDAAHSIGAKFSGRNIVDYADMTILSFHPVKHIACGEGGMVLTNDKAYYDSLCMFRSHGITKDHQKLTQDVGPWYYEMQELGFNYRLTEIQSALGISQMNKLDQSIFTRNQIARDYFKELSKLDWITLPEPISKYDWLDDPQYTELKVKPSYLHSYHLFPLQLNERINRRDFVEYMQDNKIGVQVHYIPVHLQPYYKENYGFEVGDFPIAESFYSKEVSIPMFPTLTKEDFGYVVETIRKYKPKV